ncbi:MAG: lipase maturation factor family protein [Candidatus Omnitrophica bacterium]|nr:lipase maturation factor family protein [Candidatus Omnitrophota bacterium]
MTREKPLLIFDGDCNFCRRWINRWKLFTDDRVEYVPFQDVSGQFPQISLKQFQSAVQLVDVDGQISGGAEAVFRTLGYSNGRGWMLWVYQNIPFVRPVSDWWYKLIANNRPAFSFLTRFVWGKDLSPATFSFSSWLFRRLLGVIYFVAFASLAVQVIGLFGKNGILPVQVFLNTVSERIGVGRFWFLPTLFWFNASDFFLRVVCWAGAILSAALAIGFLETPILGVLWFLYLSLFTVGGEFLGFQWDILLLEAGFLAIFLAPPIANSLAIALPARPSKIIHWLFRWLLFRLMFFSGVIKLMSGDLAWRKLTALTFHYETQPLPTWISWYFHHFPVWFHKLSALSTLAIELLVPFLVLMPKRLRLLGSILIVAFQLLIIATGNYGFFNWLTIALCVLLIDDRMWPWQKKISVSSVTKTWSKWVVVPLAGVILVMSTVEFSGLFRVDVRWPFVMARLYQVVEPLRIVNSYGLFAVMTTRRAEIIVEGSRDGETWYPYEFKCKPGDVKRQPGFIAPHQPRLDWQMWFAALGSFKINPWFVNFCIRLLQGSPEVLKLIAKNPFPDRPPRYIRAMLYEYRFTNPAELKSQKTWWHRELAGSYCPTISVENG